MMGRPTKYAIHAFGPLGRGFTLTDSDIWGLINALEHGLMDGYFKENEQWARSIVKRLQNLRVRRETEHGN